MRRTVALVVAVVALVAPAGAGAAGVTTHAFMADQAVRDVRTPALRALLDAHKAQLLSGAQYPDGGYAVASLPGGDFGEVTHWGRFVEAYVRQLRAKPGCGDLSRTWGPCAPQVAQLLGAAAHGMGDELWDWLFEPSMADHHEDPTHPLVRSGLPGFAEIAKLPLVDQVSSPEFAMDMVGIVEGGRLLALPLTLPPVDDLVATYRAIGRPDVTAAGVLAGHAAISAVAVAERVAALVEHPRVRATMPASAARYLDGQGGVRDVARSIAGSYEALWRMITTGERPPLQVVGVNPEPGATGVATDASPARTSPGPRGGGADLRIVASFGSALAPSPLPAGALRLFGPGGVEVAQLEGFPRTGPYGDGDGTHTMMAWPAQDLAPCTTYTAQVGTSVRDLGGVALAEPHRWSFTTACPPAQPVAAPSRNVLAGVLTGVGRLLGGR
ncbi:Ig-like domain-containing protein [Conexibacter sp. SYSU D00693]|uniref:Ig-like domain-containing protein n=1 Tax=Conexibacter sp. SYSU D00693 TaxID=2812560 RepID=UPI00196BA9B0|nr:Ig-like domain-containing protein [Conexibacter sp. SYSU D00693]